MAKGYVGIPTSYTPVEYIESSGTQCIDTGVVRDIAHKYRYVANINWGDVSTRQCVGAQGYVYFGVTGGYYQVAQGSTTHTSATATANTFVGIDLTFNCPARTCTGTVENQSISVSSISYENVPANAHIHLFSLNDLVLPSSVKIASFKIYQDEVLVRDFIPALDDNNVACMYEQVESKLYYNAGSSAFIAGNTTGQPVSIGSRARKLKKGYVGIPASYTPVEYIESSGTQYIDTGVAGTYSVARFEIEFALTQTVSNTEQTFIGDKNSSGSGTTIFSQSENNLNLYTWSGSGTAYQIGTMVLNAKNILDLTFTSPSGRSGTFNSTNFSSSTSNNATSNSESFAIFSSKPNVLDTPAYAKLYSLKIHINGTLVRDYIPVVDENNVACLYDQVEGKFYYNQGSGTFTAGSTTGQPVSLGDKARKIIRGYVGVNGVAKLCFGSFIPRYSTSITNTIHKNYPAVANTTDYIIVAGGQTTDGATPVKTVTAYSSSLVSTQAADMPTQASFQGACGFNGYAIIASGKSANSGSSRTNQVLAYSNNLTVSSLSTLSTAVFESTAEANDVHFIVQGGSFYTSDSSSITSYDTNFTKTTPTGMSVARRNHSSAVVGDYIVCCGGFGTRGNVDFYDNTNVRTTVSDPYGKNCDNPLGLSTNNYAIFFGGATSQNVSTAYADCKAYDRNKVLTSFNLPQAVTQAQGFSTGNYAFVGYRYDSYVYDDNLVMVENITNDIAIAYSMGTQAAATDSFAIIHQDYSTNFRVFTV